MVTASPSDDVSSLPAPVATVGVASKTPKRLEAIDLVRGVVMVVMVLDHMRAFVDNGFGNDPTNLETTTPALFMTRWVTHFCAPVFVFLAGTAAYLQLARKSRRELSRFLVTRGLWLVVLEITLVRLGAFWSFDPALFAVLQVIWALGVAMIVLAALIHLPFVAVGALGIAMIALHNLLDPIQVRPGPDLSFDGELWLILHQRGPIWLFGPEGPMTFVLYPLIPWIGVMAAGFAFGRIYAPGVDPVARRRLLVRLGLGALLAFVVLRVSNLYGDPSPWTEVRVPVRVVVLRVIGVRAVAAGAGVLEDHLARGGEHPIDGARVDRRLQRAHEGVHVEEEAVDTARLFEVVDADGGGERHRPAVLAA